MPLTRPARLTALALLAACCAAFTPAPVRREPKPDRRTDEEKLQGAWDQVSRSVHGEGFPVSPGEVTAGFDGRRLSYLAWGKGATWSFSLDPAGSPKRIDLHHEKGTLLRGIYRLEGDRLTLAYGDRAGSRRPADFKGGRRVRVDVYRRAKRGK